MNIDGLIKVFKRHYKYFIEKLVVPTLTMEEAYIVEKYSRGEKLNNYEQSIMAMVITRASIILGHRGDKNISRNYKMYMNVYELLMPYTKKQVDEAMLKLNDKEKEIIYLRCGGTNLNCVDLNANMTGAQRTRFYVIINVMFNILRNPKYRSKEENVLDEILDMNSVNTLGTLLHNKLDAILISLLLGYNKYNKRYEIKEIVKLLNMDEEIVLIRARKALKIYERRKDAVDSVYGGKTI